MQLSHPTLLEVISPAHESAKSECMGERPSRCSPKYGIRFHICLSTGTQEGKVHSITCEAFKVFRPASIFVFGCRAPQRLLSLIHRGSQGANWEKLGAQVYGSR
jgi:hypothetical protein